MNYQHQKVMKKIPTANMHSNKDGKAKKGYIRIGGFKQLQLSNRKIPVLFFILFWCFIRDQSGKRMNF